MPITTADIKLYQPEVLDDTDNGGGRMSGNVIVDNELNNLFDDQSRFDRVTGRVSLRKLFGAATNQDRTKLLGAHAILLARALDDRVHVSMFARDDHTDRRLAAQQHLEQYLAAGPATGYYCYETQPEGALAVVFFTHKDNADPPAGETLVLSVERGTINLGQQQYVRAISVSSEIVTVPISATGSATVKLVTIEIDQPLRFDVPGEVLASTLPTQPKTVVRRTTLAAGKRYYSIHPITSPITAGDVSFQVDTIMTPVVPSAEQESPVTDQQVGSDTTAIVPLRPDEPAHRVTESIRGVTINSAAAVYLPLRAIAPGTATVTLRPSGQSSSHTAVLSDDGRGVLVRQPSSGASVPATCAGTIDYINGSIVVSDLSINSGTIDATYSTVVYRPACAIVDAQHTDGIEIDANNRGLVYNRTLLPHPVPGALTVSYRALGRWIDLKDRGDGTIAGASGEGTGTINYATGTVTVTLGAEPDIGSYLLFGWGSGAHYQGPSGAVQATSQELPMQAAEVPIKPGTVAITYDIGATTYTSTDDGAGGLTGDATGSVDYATGEIRAKLTEIPASGTPVNLAYQTEGNRYTETPTPGGSGGTVTIALANGNVDPRSVRLRTQYSFSVGSGDPTDVELIDDGSGNIQTRISVRPPGTPETRYYLALKGSPAGTIDYVSGVISLNENATFNRIYYLYSPATGTWVEQPGTLDALFESLTDARYSSAGSPQAQADATTIDTLEIALDGADLLAGIMPGSFYLAFNGRQYYDNAGLVYYRDVNGQQTVGGSIDYAAGTIALTAWEAGTAASIVEGVLVTYGRWGLTDVFWRAPVDNIRTGSFQVVYQRYGQPTQDSATADNSGDITGPQLTGHVNYATGVYALTFAEQVVPETARYNATATTFLPLDPDIIGVDPVRLSVDGRVPTINSADVLVLHNTQETALPNPVIAGQTYGTRPYVSLIEIFDANEAQIPTDRYTYDKTTGDITFANPLNLDGYTQPLTARHRIEDMALCTDAQINGTISVNSQITHDYPAGTSYISSALPLGNERQASAYNLFTQAAWTNEWADAPIGGGTSGQYNAVAYPIQTTNRGAIRERWRIEFTSVTAFRIIGETVGQVGVGDTSTDAEPINPATGDPYFTMLAAGWSSGWSIGNQVRFNTEAAAVPIWVNRTTLPGPLTDPTDRVTLEFRGDAN